LRVAVQNAKDRLTKKPRNSASPGAGHYLPNRRAGFARAVAGRHESLLVQTVSPRRPVVVGRSLAWNAIGPESAQHHRASVRKRQPWFWNWARVFTDNAVLQRDQPCTIYGKDVPAPLSRSLLPGDGSTLADVGGHWR